MMLSPSPKDVPIIFSATMILALLDGRKTMTRRLAWRGNGKKGANYVAQAMHSPWRKVRPGDRLWVRETWRVNSAATDVAEIVYKASVGLGYTACVEQIPAAIAKDAVRLIYKPGHISPIYMPRWASRLTLIVTATKIERVQEITNEEAEAEGVKCDMSIRSFKEHFKILWCDLHGYDSWDANPECVCMSFSVHKANIDTLPKSEAA